jgi:U3 small nucleolar RNA-associated protein 18
MLSANAKRRHETAPAASDDNGAAVAGGDANGAAIETSHTRKKVKPAGSRERQLASALFGAAGGAGDNDIDNDNDDDNDDDDGNDDAALATNALSASELGQEALRALLRGAAAREADADNDGDDDDDGGGDDDDDDDERDDGRVAAAGDVDTDGAAAASALPAVWHDEDDENDNDAQVSVVAKPAHKRYLRKTLAEKEITPAAYAQRLREQFVKLQPHKTAWANVAADGDGDGDDAGFDVARTSKPLVEARREANQARIVRLRNANAQEPSKAAVQAVDFHSSGALLLTGGFDKTLRLFRCDGRVNEKLRSVFFDDFPLHSAFFLRDEIVCTSRRAHMHAFDLTTGATTRFVPRLGSRFQKSLEVALPSPDGSRIAVLGTSGHIDLLSARTKQWQAALKMNGLVDAVVFAHNDCNRMYSAGTEGRVYEWDLRTMSAIDRWRVDGAMSISALALSPDGGTLAVGDDAGIVSLFDVRRGAAAPTTADDDEQWLMGGDDRRERAARECSNLTTTITSLQFSHDGTALAFSSNRRKQALRLYNTVDRCVYANWPAPRDQVGYVTSFAWSPVNSLFSIGDLKGSALLFRQL